ncbi:MAG: hypothetical protein K8S15_09940, partial [Candidatus Aegiribacteria sp.]|nr:hypothetical protein [Candidatus Aegiribacteria sp.]
MNNFVIQIIAFSVIGGVVWGLSRLLRCKPLDPGIAKPKRSSLHATIAVTFSMLLFAIVTMGMRSLQAEAPGLEMGYTNLGDLVKQFLPLILMLLSVGIFIIRDGESLRSIGITSTNLWQSAVIGSVLVLITFYLQHGDFLAVLESLKPRHGYSFVY